MVVGVHRVLGAEDAAKEFDGPVGDDLVGVHVGLGARSRLPDDQGEVGVQGPRRYFVGGTHDGVGDGGLQLAQGHIDGRCCFFLDAERAEHRSRHGLGADGEILQAALSLGAPITVGRDRDLAQAVAFDAGGGHGRASGVILPPPRPPTEPGGFP